MKFKILQQAALYRGFLSLTRIDLEVDLYNGKTVQVRREVMERGDAVAVLLVDPVLKEVILIEQFHPGSALNTPTEAWHLGVVAGGIKPGETPVEVAERETLEEVGMQARNLELLTSYYPSAGGSSEKIFLFYGEVDATTAPAFSGCPEEHEDIRVIRCSYQKAFLLLDQGKFRGANALIAIQHLKLRQSP